MKGRFERSIEDCYASLAIAIIEDAVDEYVRCAKRLQEDNYRRNKTLKVADRWRYERNVKYFMQSCNGPVSEVGEVIIETLNKRNGIDVKKVEASIKRMKGGERIEISAEVCEERDGEDDS